MYDIYDDELKEMYESKESSGDTLDKGISPNDPLSTLSQEKFIVLNEQSTLREAIDNIQKYHIGCILLENEKKIKNGHYKSIKNIFDYFFGDRIPCIYFFIPCFICKYIFK